MTDNVEKIFNQRENAAQLPDANYTRTKAGNLYYVSAGSPVGLRVSEEPSEAPGAEAVQTGLDTSASFDYLMQKAEQDVAQDTDVMTVDRMIATPEIVYDAMQIYEMFEGQPFRGGADDVIDYALNVQSDFMFNIGGIPGVGTDAGGTIAQAAHILSQEDPDKAQAFLDFMGAYEQLPTFTSAGVSRAFRSIFTDPTTYAGIVSAGAGLFARQTTQTGIKLGIKQALQQMARPAQFATQRPVAAGALAGAGYSEVGEVGQMAVETAAGDAPTPLEAGIRATVAPAVGAAVGAGAAKGAEVLLPPVGQAIGDLFEGMGEGAKKRMSESGTTLTSGVDPDPLIAAAGDAVKAIRGKPTINLSEGERAGTLIDELYGQGTIEPGGNLYDVAVKLNQKSKAGGDRSAQNNENQEAIAKMMAAEIMEAMKAKGNAADWYKTKITNAMSIASRLYPELATDQTAASSFKFIMAITSNGADVATNVANTVDAYGVYRKTNKMPIVGYGREKPSMEFGFRLFNELEEKLGSREEVFKLLNTKMKVRDLVKIGKEYGFKVSGENMGTELPASAMFGPKIGGAFYQNLEGNMDMLTMDRWFMRMWGRMSGTLIPERSPALLAKQQTRARDATTPELAQEYGFVYDDIINDDTILSDFASAVHKKFAAGNFKDKREFTRSMKALDEGGTKVLETPSGGGHRSYMRATVDRAVELLREQGMQTDAASAQALLWYPEKELYGKLGVGNKKSAPTDYEAELAKIARERGIDVSDITGQP